MNTFQQQNQDGQSQSENPFLKSNTPRVGYSHEGGRYFVKFDSNGIEIPWSREVYEKNTPDFLVHPSIVPKK